jgi:hypothetical protein
LFTHLRHMALVLKSKYFDATTYFALHSKIYLRVFENINPYPFPGYFPLESSVFLCCFI